MPHEDDFLPDAAGLQHALDLMVAARSAEGRAHADPDAPLGLPTKWPLEPVGGRAALDLLAGPALRQAARLDHPGFLAHMDPPTPWMTWATTAWAAAMNQNLLHPDAAPAARRLEQLVIDWLAPSFGMRGGHMVPGSTVANLTALWAARDIAAVRRVVTSSAAHLSVAKAAHILGLELVQVPTDAEQRLRVDALPDDLSDAALVLTAGSAATGAIDPLAQLRRAAAWTHVDAAWAGPLVLSSHAHLLNGIEDADSVGFSAHKWLYQPKDSAVVLFAEPQQAHAALSFGGAYLTAPNVGVLGSRGDRALPLAATLLAWGRAGVAGRIDADMALAAQFAELLDGSDDLDLWRRPVTGVVNWRPSGADAESVQGNLHDGWFSLTSINGETWCRSVAANPRAQPDQLLDATRSAVREARSLHSRTGPGDALLPQPTTRTA